MNTSNIKKGESKDVINLTFQRNSSTKLKNIKRDEYYDIDNTKIVEQVRRKSSSVILQTQKLATFIEEPLFSPTIEVDEKSSSLPDFFENK